MLKKHNKDLLERLINHTMQHGKKGAAIGLLARSFLLFKQTLTRQTGASPSMRLRRGEKMPHIVCTLLKPTVPNQQSTFALGVRETYVAIISPHARKETQTLPNPLTNLWIGHNITTGVTRSAAILTFSMEISSPPAIGDSDFQETASAPGARLPNPIPNRSTHHHFVHKMKEPRDNTSSNLNQSLIGNMSSNKISSVTTARGTSLALMGVQDVSKGNKGKTGERGGNGRSSTKEFVKDAISNIKPSLETRKKKIAGITRHVPSIVSPSRGEGLAIRWLLAAAKEKQRRGGKELAICLSDQLLDAYLKRGEARQKRDSLHKLAESNRSYIRYRWW